METGKTLESKCLCMCMYTYMYTYTYNIFMYKLFSKRDAFPISIVRMPDLSSNIPSKIFYGALSELSRIARATLLFDDFMSRTSQLYHRMGLQGGSRAKLNLQKRKAIRKYPSVFETTGQLSEDRLRA